MSTSTSYLLYLSVGISDLLPINLSFDFWLLDFLPLVYQQTTPQGKQRGSRAQQTTNLEPSTPWRLVSSSVLEQQAPHGLGHLNGEATKPTGRQWMGHYLLRWWTFTRWGPNPNDCNPPSNFKSIATTWLYDYLYHGHLATVLVFMFLFHGLWLYMIMHFVHALQLRSLFFICLCRNSGFW